MKKICLIILLFSSMMAWSQSLKPEANKKGIYGYIDATGKDVIKYQFSTAQPFINGKALVSKYDKYWFINENGEEAYKDKTYNDVLPFGPDKYRVKGKKDKWGIITKDGIVLTECTFTYISDLNYYGKAFAYNGKIRDNKFKDGTYSIFKADGITHYDAGVIFGELYDKTKKITPENMATRTGGTQTRDLSVGDTLLTDCNYIWKGAYTGNINCLLMLDENGKEVFPMGKKVYEFTLPQYGMVYYLELNGTTLTQGCYNIETQKFHPMHICVNPDKTNLFSDSIFIRKIEKNIVFYGKPNGTCGEIYNRYGEKLLGNILYYDEMTNNDKHVYITNEKFGFIDNNGNISDNSNGFSNWGTGHSNGILAVEKGEKWGYLNLNTGSLVVPTEYEEACTMAYGIGIAKKEGKWGMINNKNKVIVPFEYDNILAADKENTTNIWVQKGANWYNFDVNKQKCIGNFYSNVSTFRDDMAEVRTSEMDEACAIIVDKKNNIIFGYPFIINDYTDQAIREFIISRDKKTVSNGMAKAYLLRLLRDSRKFLLTDKIKEENWDY